MRWFGFVIVMILLSSCALQEKKTAPEYQRQYPYDQDGVHDQIPVDLALIREIIPRYEPKSKYGNPETYTVFGKTYRVLKSASGYRQQGYASWYGKKFHGQRTSSGEPYDMYALSAAHKTLPLPTYVRVTNLENGKSLIVRVNDRGPFHDKRIIDLSYAAAWKLGILKKGTAWVEVAAVAANVENDDENSALQKNILPAPEQHKTAAMAGQQYIQAGAFSTVENATRITEQIQAITTLPVFVQSRSTHAGKLFVVMIGPLTSRQKVQYILRQLKKLGLR